MSNELIGDILTLAGVIIVSILGNATTRKQLKEHWELIEYRIKQLEEKQDKYNQVKDRMFEAEAQLRVLDEKIAVANHRISDLEK